MADYSKFETDNIFEKLRKVCNNTLENTIKLKFQPINDDEFIRTRKSVAIRFSGEYEGVIYTTFDNDRFPITITEKLLGKKVKPGDINIQAAIKEIGNIIGGNIAAALEESGIDIDLDSNLMLMEHNPKTSHDNIKKYFKYKYEDNTIQIIFVVK